MHSPCKIIKAMGPMFLKMHHFWERRSVAHITLSLLTVWLWVLAIMVVRNTVYYVGCEGQSPRSRVFIGRWCYPVACKKWTHRQHLLIAQLPSLSLASHYLVKLCQGVRGDWCSEVIFRSRVVEQGLYTSLHWRGP